MAMSPRILSLAILLITPLARAAEVGAGGTAPDLGSSALQMALGLVVVLALLLGALWLLKRISMPRGPVAGLMRRRRRRGRLARTRSDSRTRQQLAGNGSLPARSPRWPKSRVRSYPPRRAAQPQRTSRPGSNKLSRVVASLSRRIFTALLVSCPGHRPGAGAARHHQYAGGRRRHPVVAVDPDAAAHHRPQLPAGAAADLRRASHASSSCFRCCAMRSAPRLRHRIRCWSGWRSSSLFSLRRHRRRSTLRLPAARGEQDHLHAGDRAWRRCRGAAS